MRTIGAEWPETEVAVILGVDTHLDFHAALEIPVADIYANVLASAIWDRGKSALARQNKDDAGVIFSLVETDEDGNMRRELRGETRNPEAIKELIRQFGKDQE